MKSSRETSTVFVWLGLLIITVSIQSVQGTDLAISISTDPPGPTYPAASWIHITCQPTDYNSSDILTYTWVGSCNGTGEIVFDIVDPYLDSDGWSAVWLPSTPHYCLDYLECQVTNTVEGTSGSASLLVEDTFGVGVAIKDQFLGSIPNNSIIISDGSHVNILCHSASKTACSGQWLSPTAEILTIGSQCSPLIYSYVSLTVVEEQNSGIYTCTIDDEHDNTQSVYIGVYTSLKEVEHEAERFLVELDYSMKDNMRGITFTCNTKGLPVTSTAWSKNSANVVDNNNVEQMNMLVDSYSSSYATELTVQRSNLSSFKDCTLKCDVYSNWAVADQSDFGRQHVSGEFVIKEVGDTATLECLFPPNHNGTEWILPDTLIEESSIYSPTANSALLAFLVTDLLHGASFRCQARNPKGNRVYKHYMLLAYVPDNAIIMEITDSDFIIKDTSAPKQHHNISCCVSIEVKGITSTPTVNWYNAHREMISNGGDFHLQKVAADNHYCTMFQFPSESCGDKLLCMATLSYSTDSEPLVKTMEYSIMRPIGDSTISDRREMPSVVLVIIGTMVTVILVAILVTLTAVLTLVLYKRGRQGSSPEV